MILWNPEHVRRSCTADSDVIGHVSHEIFGCIWYFSTQGRRIEATVLPRPKPFLISSGAMEIMLKAKLIIDEKHDDILKHLRELIEENYNPDISDTKKKQGSRRSWI